MRRSLLVVAALGCHAPVHSPSLAGPDAATAADATGSADAGGSAGPDAALAPVSISVTSQAMGLPIDGRFAGLSYEKGMLFRNFFRTSNPSAVALFERLGQSLIRIGGGSCDTLPWNAAGAGLTPGEIAPPDIDALAEFLDVTGWTVLYCVNLKTGTPALAADEVAYATKVLGSHLVGFEIGNEPDNYGSAWPAQQYISTWQSFAAAVVAETPTAVLTGPALGSLLHDSTYEPLVLSATPAISEFTQHFYIECAGKPGADLTTMMSGNGIPFSGLDALDTSMSIPYRMAETNSYCGGGVTGASDTAGSALWAIDYLFAIAKHGGTGANFHTLSPNVSSVLLDSNGTITQVRPIYYGILLFQLAGGGQALQTTQNAGGLNVTAYALDPGDGSLRVLVVNQTLGTPIAYTVDAGRPVAGATGLVLAAPALDATTGVTIGGATVGLDGGFAPTPPQALATSGTTISGQLAPASAVLIVAQ